MMNLLNFPYNLDEIMQDEEKYSVDQNPDKTDNDKKNNLEKTKPFQQNTTVVESGLNNCENGSRISKKSHESG